MTPRRSHRSWIRFEPALAIGMLAFVMSWTGCDRPDPSNVNEATEAEVSAVVLDPDVRRRALAASPLLQPPPDPTNRWADEPEAAAFGRRMFFDSRLSSDGSVSCATCHQPARRFTDGRSRSVGIGTADRHAPSLVDAAHHRWFNWDGRSDSMWAHAIRPIENPREMGGDRTAVVRLVLEDPELRAGYESIFGPIELVAGKLPAKARPRGDETASEAWSSMSVVDRRRVDAVVANLGKAMAAYQRTLRSEPSRFDRWVADVSAGGDGSMNLSDAEVRGMSLFFGRAECWECHSGAFFSDGEFHNIGIPVPEGLPRDPGRYDGSLLVREDPFNAAGLHSDAPDGVQAILSAGVKHDPEGWGAFRTPSLRGVGDTPPYMHDGSMPDLETVVRFYSTLEGATQLDHHQESVLTPLLLEPSEIDDLVAFLESLGGSHAGREDAALQ